jgi:polyferredoxin
MRTILYPVVLTIMLGGLGAAMYFKEAADLTVLRGLDGPFTTEADGRIANQVRVKITNRRGDPMAYTITLDSLGGGDIRANEITAVIPENPMLVNAGATKSSSLFILLPARAFTNGEKWVWVSVSDPQGYHETVKYRLLGPSGPVPSSK